MGKHRKTTGYPYISRPILPSVTSTNLQSIKSQVMLTTLTSHHFIHSSLTSLSFDATSIIPPQPYRCTRVFPYHSGDGVTLRLICKAQFRHSVVPKNVQRGTKQVISTRKSFLLDKTDHRKGEIQAKLGMKIQVNGHVRQTGLAESVIWFPPRPQSRIRGTRLRRLLTPSLGEGLPVVQKLKV
jgi:hypothetical protein